MQVQDSQAYTTLLNTQGTYAAQAAAKNAQKSTTEAAPSSATQADVTGQSANNAVTGTTGSNLSKDVMGQLIAAQETGVSSTDAKAYDGPLSIGERHHLEDIANNPRYAASQANLFGTGSELVFVGKMLPTVNNGYSDADRETFLTKQAGQMANEKQAQGERTAYYESLMRQGLPPAEIFAKLLEFNTNLPESHDATLGWSESGVSLSYSDYQKARLDYLQNLISQGQSALVSEKTADSTEVSLPIAIQHHLDDIANKPEYAATQSKLVGKHLTAIVSTGGLLSSLGNTASLAEKEAILSKMDQIKAANAAAFAPREMLYESKTAEGVPSAQIYADILAFNATQNEYNALADKEGGKPAGYTTAMFKAAHDHLQKAIAAANVQK